MNNTTAAKILPNLKGIIRIGNAGFLRSNGGKDYSAFTAQQRYLGNAATFTDARNLVIAA